MNEGINTENCNLHRGARVDSILKQSPYDEGNPKEGVVDLLTDLLHMCNQRSIDFAMCLTSARGHYYEEVRLANEHKEMLKAKASYCNKKKPVTLRLGGTE